MEPQRSGAQHGPGAKCTHHKAGPRGGPKWGTMYLEPKNGANFRPPSFPLNNMQWSSRSNMSYTLGRASTYPKRMGTWVLYWVLGGPQVVRPHKGLTKVPVRPHGLGPSETHLRASHWKKMSITCLVIHLAFICIHRYRCSTFTFGATRESPRVSQMD